MPLIRRGALALLAGGLLLGCTAVEGDDDDSAGGGDGPAGCTVVSSGGSGGDTGSSWVTVPGWTDAGTDTPEYEVVVFRPPGLTGPTPLALLTANPVPADRADIEQIVFEFIGSGLGNWAETYGYTFGFPVGGGVEGGELATRTARDEPYFGDAIDAVTGQFDIDLNSIHLFGRSGGGRLAIQMAQFQATKVASIMSLAGPQPFPNWESGEPEWERAVGGLFIHDENDPVVGRPTVLDTVTMFQSFGGQVETFFEYTGGHDWNAEQVEPRMAEFFGRTCIQ
ncbi:MAG: hypothetical protein KDA24_10785 [Deltaproteobacteria bacterium]|nr:hypothetical protein [Deltaproteobacteria bacterium]